MATKTITTKVDDIDGSPAEASFTFSYQGYKYHIDLSDAHSAEMKADFDKWVSAARRDRGGVRQAHAAKPAVPEKAPEAAPKAAAKRGPRAATKPAKAAKSAKPAARRARAAKKTGPSAADIRVWAAEKGVQVATRGRIAPAIIAQYLEDKASE